MSTPNTYPNADTGLPDPAVTRVAEVPKPDLQQVPSARSVLARVRGARLAAGLAITGKLAVLLAALVSLGALVAGASPASAAVSPAVSANAAYNRTTTNNFYYEGNGTGTSFEATLQTNDGWNGNIVQFNWLSHSVAIQYGTIDTWSYQASRSSFGHYYSGDSTIDWGNYAFTLIAPNYLTYHYCVYLRNVTNKVGYLYTQDFGQWNGGGNC